MSVLRAIGRALRAMVMTVVVWSEELGKFVMKCMPGYVPHDPQDLVDQYIEVAKAEAAAPKPDERLASIQEVADLIFRRQAIPDEILVGLGDKTLMWLEALNADMLLLAAKAKPEDLRAHLAGGRSIKGLLAYDADSIAAYQQALERNAAAPKPEPKRQRKRAEPLLPAFGPMC